jgi:hypothetical protein
MPREKKEVTSGADMNDREILEKAIGLVKENAPEHRDLIGLLAATAQSLSGLQPAFDLKGQVLAYSDRPQAIVKTVLDGMHYNR